MGKWTLESITPSFNDLDGGENYGTNFKVELRLTYVPSRLTPFKESPVLDWHEKFTTLWHHDNSYWTFESNMFRLRPDSITFQAWSKRYIAAYTFVVTGQHLLLRRGTVKFYDKKGRPLSPDVFAGKRAETDEEKAAVIREYLAKQGGVFVIEILDMPSIVTNTQAGTAKHVERLLLFDCGLEGDSKRVKAMQYLNVNTSQHRNNWQREFQIPAPSAPSAPSAPFTRNDLPNQGLRRVEPPNDVTRQTNNLLRGEYL